MFLILWSCWGWIFKWIEPDEITPAKKEICLPDRLIRSNEWPVDFGAHFWDVIAS